MPNGDFTIDDFQPSWMEDGYGISGPQGDAPDEQIIQWDIDAWTDDSKQAEDFIGASAESCMANAGDPPESGTWILGSIDGTCQWIDTTDCSA